MSTRLRVFTNSLTAILVLNALSISAGFLFFIWVAEPYVGQRLAENMGYIAARYFLFAAIAVLTLTGIGALWVISVNVRHVTGPLRRLKRAAIEIRDGNLEHELPTGGHDEFAELAACFEQMRIRLKDSVYLKEKAETERRAMMASVTHDLNTPIASIVGYSEGIIDGVANTPQKIKEYAAVINKKARSLQVLAEDLNLLSRLENAQLPLNIQEEDFGLFVTELTEEFSHNAPELELDTGIVHGLRVLIDKEKMARVITNILQNSIKFKKPEQSAAQVHISLLRQNGDALLTISDNGIGTRQSDLPFLLDRFYRADTARDPKSGSGLGLSIARHIVLLHGGKIWIIINPTGGISVNVMLPLH